MPAQVARILVSVLLLGLGGMFYAALVVIQWSAFRFDFIPASTRFWVAGIVSWLFVRVGWCFVWRDQIVRNERRRRQSVAVTLATFALAPLLWILFFKGWDIDSDLAAIFASSIAPLAGLIGTVIVYSETPGDRAHRAMTAKKTKVRCLACGYNLAGLTSTTCPECGTEYTVDALVAAQAVPPGRDV